MALCQVSFGQFLHCSPLVVATAIEGASKFMISIKTWSTWSIHKQCPVLSILHTMEVEITVGIVGSISSIGAALGLRNIHGSQGLPPQGFLLAVRHLVISRTLGAPLWVSILTLFVLGHWLGEPLDEVQTQKHPTRSCHSSL